MPAKPRDPCKKYACIIQDCLEKNDYQEERCAVVLEQMRRCCLIHHRVSLCCSGIRLDRPYLPESADAPETGTASVPFRTTK